MQTGHTKKPSCSPGLVANTSPFNRVQIIDYEVMEGDLIFIWIKKRK
jgi:hypothetical protein